MSNSVTAMIHEFLRNGKVLSEHGDWAPVTKDDLRELSNIINALIRLKWEPTTDGDLPVEATLVARDKHERMKYQPLPYQFVAGTNVSPDEYLAIATTNLMVATDDITRAHNYISYGMKRCEQHKKFLMDALTKQNILRATHGE